jgi:hypothetical protein
MQEVTSSSNQFQLVRLESIMLDLYRSVDFTGDIFTQEDMLESAAEAAEALGTHKLVETAACIKPVYDHRTLIPDYKQIQFIFYKPFCDDNTNIETIETKKVCLTAEDDADKLVTTDVYEIKEAALKMNWTPMRPGHSIRTMINANSHPYVDEENCAKDSSTNYCDMTYSVKGCNLTVSPKEGLVLVLYKRLLRDEDGHPLIPDIPIFKKAIKSHVLMQINEAKMNMHREGALGLYRTYETRWEKQQAVARSQNIMLTMPEWIDVITETNRFIKNDPIERLYDQHYGPEHTYYGNHSHNYYW